MTDATATATAAVPSIEAIEESARAQLSMSGVPVTQRALATAPHLHTLLGSPASTCAAPPVRGIEDFGVKIPGARKDMSAQKRRETSSGSTTSLSAAWPAPDYADLIAKGAAASSVAVVRALRDLIPLRPTRVLPAEYWTATVRDAKAAAHNFIAGHEGRDHAMAAFKRRVGKWSAERAMLNSNLYLTAGHDRSLRGYNLRCGFGHGSQDAQARRQRDINDAHDALLDLAAALVIPSRAMSLHGELAIAFGARGRNGHHAAHYERINVVINLTKTQGPGSLAHEWWHALDNALSRWAGAPGEMMTDTRRAPPVGLDPRVLDAFRFLRERLATSSVARRSRALDRRRAKAYFGLPIEISARAFEAYVIAKLAATGGRNDYLANVKPVDLWDVPLAVDETGTYPYPLADELAPIAEAFDAIFSALADRAAGSRFGLGRRETECCDTPTP